MTDAPKEIWPGNLGMEECRVKGPYKTVRYLRADKVLADMRRLWEAYDGNWPARCPVLDDIAANTGSGRKGMGNERQTAEQIMGNRPPFE